MKTKCEGCNQEHEWDASQDYYPTCKTDIHSLASNGAITAEYFICPCETVLAVFITSPNGGTLFTTCKEEL